MRTTRSDIAKADTDTLEWKLIEMPIQIMGSRDFSLLTMMSYYRMREMILDELAERGR